MTTSSPAAPHAILQQRPLRVGLVGYGEVGCIFAAALKTQADVAHVTAWDVLLAQPSSPADHADWPAAARERARADGIALAPDMVGLLAASDLIISAVTASSTLAVAQQLAQAVAASGSGHRPLLLDVNSASPGTKQHAAAVLQAVGVDYVEAGVMTSVPPYGLRVPMLLGGAQAHGLAQRMAAWGMDAKPLSDQVGVASAIKMCRSVMIKGLEALVIESYSVARAYGVEDHVLPTLVETFPSIDWQRQGSYFFARVIEHGKRRAEEMREAARTVQEAGFDPTMASAIADKQQWMADQRAAGVFDALAFKTEVWQAAADRLLAAQHKTPPTHTR